ncbi:hypothetical protein L218DRAFT_119320 [Marasmius fiardii PR-910]|nr:hypothetical protein L218DRAFT_119320 [Marasmius fiardii PR-910]
MKVCWNLSQVLFVSVLSIPWTFSHGTLLRKIATHSYSQNPVHIELMSDCRLAERSLLLLTRNVPHCDSLSRSMGETPRERPAAFYIAQIGESFGFSSNPDTFVVFDTYVAVLAVTEWGVALEGFWTFK